MTDSSYKYVGGLIGREDDDDVRTFYIKRGL